MPDINGTAYSATDPLKRAPGTSVNAGVRRYRNVVNLAVEGGGTANPILAAKLKEGVSVCAVKIHSDANLSGINFTVGSRTDAAKYAAAQAGPNVTSKELVMKVAALAADALGAAEDVLFTPSGALPANGMIVVEVFASKR